MCTVVKYIEDLLSTREFGIRVQQKEIGVISPYRKQVLKIRAKLASKNIPLESIFEQMRAKGLSSSVEILREFLNMTGDSFKRVRQKAEILDFLRCQFMGLWVTDST